MIDRKDAMALEQPLGIDSAAFAADLQALRREIDASLGPDDVRHLLKVERWGRLCAVVGYLTAWVAPNPLSAFLLSQANFTRWIIAHHVRHGGYDKLEGVPARLTSKVFAVGRRRYIDWLDWMQPQAWDYEHNVLHHYHLGQRKDPDLPERNLEFVRDLPVVARYAFMTFLALTWKYSYYAANTLLHLRRRRPADGAPRPPEGSEPAEPLTIRAWAGAWVRFDAVGRELWRTCLLPYGLVRFVLAPALFLPLGLWAYVSVLANSLLAEALTNAQSFLMIVPNHSGDDLYRFEQPPGGKAEFYVHQVLGSANYASGSDGIDFLHGWLNYQIEHHVWPDLPMSAYRRAQPLLEALCQRHGVPYVRESVFARFKKMLDVALGKASMRRMPSAPRP